MCFVLESLPTAPIFPEPSKATKNIIVWKVVTEIKGTDNVRANVYRRCIYKPNKRQPVKPLKLERSSNHRMRKGLVMSEAYINRGYHSYSTEKEARKQEYWWPLGVIKTFIIPKGALYFKDEKNEQYVSNTIIYKPR